MTDLFEAPIIKLCGKFTASELLDAAKITKTQSGDYQAGVGGRHLELTDDYGMAVFAGGTWLGRMVLTSDEQDKLIELMMRVEASYEGKFEQVR